jgi:hypothetical protein
MSKRRTGVAMPWIARETGAAAVRSVRTAQNAVRLRRLAKSLRDLRAAPRCQGRAPAGSQPGIGSLVGAVDSGVARSKSSPVHRHTWTPAARVTITTTSAEPQRYWPSSRGAAVTTDAVATG